jgi:hypothetical protein
MAYTQNPGRGNSAKTGHGIPAPFKQEKIELTTDYERGKKRLAEARKKGGKNYVSGLSAIEGITVDPASGKATANAYEKTFRPGEGQKGGESRTNASIVSGGKTIKVSGPGLARRTNADLYKEYKSDSTSTMQSRNRNAKFYNITSGAKNPDLADKEEKEMLVGTFRAKKSPANQMKSKKAPAKMKKC